jgi:hypothetical protein
VAALHVFPDLDDAVSGGVESCQGRRLLAFISTLDSSPRHFIIERGTKRNAVQLSFVLSGRVWILFFVRGMPARPYPLVLGFGIAVHRTYIDSRFSKSSQKILAGATHVCPASIRTLNGPLLGLGACWGSL